jgi:hypothetical protein
MLTLGGFTIVDSSPIGSLVGFSMFSTLSLFKKMGEIFPLFLKVSLLVRSEDFSSKVLFVIALIFDIALLTGTRSDSTSMD